MNWSELEVFIHITGINHRKIHAAKNIHVGCGFNFHKLRNTCMWRKFLKPTREHSEGKPHLILNWKPFYVFLFHRCHAEFCYRCGGKYHHLKFLGNHYDRYSVLGCKYNFKPDKPAQRLAVRGALFSGQVMLMPIVAGLVVSAGCVVLGAGVVAAPFYGSYILIKRQRAKNKRTCKSKKK